MGKVTHHQERVALEDTTVDLIAETNKRAANLQRLAFEASSTLYPSSDVDYFIVSREYYSGLFYGFTTNCSIETILQTLPKRRRREEMQEERTSDIVGLFREAFSKSLERTGVLRRLTDALSQSVESQRLTIAVSFYWSGEVKARRIFGQDSLVCKDPPNEIKNTVQAIERIDERIAGMARSLARVHDSPTSFADGFCVIVQSNERLEEPYPLRRPKIQLMQIGLVVNWSSDELELESSCLPNILQTAIASSKVAAYSVLYEKERYFEKAIRQAIRGSVIKWGLREQHIDFRNQLEALDSCNLPKMTHGAPVVLTRQYDLNGTGTDARADAKEDPLPWYEMVRYKIPSLDALLTATRGLQRFEVQSLARATFMHLDQHFWKFSNQPTVGDTYEAISAKAVPIASFLMLKDHVERCTEKYAVKIEQWKKNVPIQLGVGGLDLPTKEWRGEKSLSGSLLEARLSDIEVEIKVQQDVEGLGVQASFPDTTISKLITSWNDDKLEQSINLPKYRIDKCHGDPHFENILVDASIPEDPFIVAIDPSSADYYKSKAVDTTFQRCVENLRTREEILREMKHQPIHDVAKLLLSTSGSYALIMKDGFSGEFDQVRSPPKYSLSWRSHSTTLPLGLDGGGVSGARIFFRSVSATPEAKLYQYYFATEILAQFDAQMDVLLERCNILSETVVTICKNTFLIQLWATVVRHTFLIAETLFPGRAEKSDQALAFAIYLLEAGAKLLENGSICLRSTDTTESILKLLSLHDMMVENHEK